MNNFNLRYFKIAVVYHFFQLNWIDREHLQQKSLLETLETNNTFDCYL